MTGMRGQTLILLFSTAIAVVAVVGFLTLQRAQHLRFATSIHAVPESPYHDLVPLGQPIKVRIDKASAGRSKGRSTRLNSKEAEATGGGAALQRS